MNSSDLLRSALRRDVAQFVPISDAVVDACVGHYELLARWNQRLNLTSVLKPEEAAVRHYGQSLFLAAHLTPGSVVDIGSGAGFPGIPTAFLRPDCIITLVESDRRKAAFLREATRTVPNVAVSSVRAEAVDGRFDWLISRAVATKELLALRLAPHVALLMSEASAAEGELWSTPLPWGGGVLASRDPLVFHVEQ